MRKTVIIAEAGVNHNGSLNVAIKLVEKAAACGVDAVKFQTFNTDALVTQDLEKVPYQIRNMGTTESQFQMLKKLELDRAAFKTLIECCRTHNVLFISTPYDEASVDLLDDLGVASFKIPSAEIVNLPLLTYIADKQKPIILSTGMSFLEEVQEAVDTIQAQWKQTTSKPTLTLLHCVSNYPSTFEGTNLKAMETLRATFGLPVGYSDHTPGIECAVAAVALGAEVIEKHFTLDKMLEGPDHKASLDVPELKALVRSIRHVEQALGNGEKKPMPEEAPARRMMRRSLVAARNIRANEVIQRKDIAIKRPGHGLPPKEISSFIQRKARRDISKDALLKRTDIQDV